MSHDLESGTLSSGAVATAFASRGEPGWHLLGTTFPAADKVSTEDMLSLAHLNGWDVRKVPVVAFDKVAGKPPVRVGQDRHSVESYAVLRTNPFDGLADMLATVGKKYTTLQNESAFNFGSVLTDGGAWETAGSIKGGRQVFGSLVLPEHVLANGERLSNYILVTTSHDGSVPLTLLNTPVRVVCSNTLNMALNKSTTRQAYRIRHTSGGSAKIQEARNFLGINVAYMDEFSIMVNAMIDATITKDQAVSILNTVEGTPKDGSKIAETKHDNKIEKILALYEGRADGQPDTSAGPNLWGLFNADTEYHDWHRTAQNGDEEAKVLALAGFDPVANGKRQAIFDVFGKVLASV